MKKNIVFIFLLQIMIISIAFSAYAGQWCLDAHGWWYDKGDGTWPSGQWQWLDGNGDGIEECYYFNPSGYCMINTITPDGYTVNYDGAWIVNGVVQKKYVDNLENFGIWKLYNGKWYVVDVFGSRKTNGWYWLDGNQDGIAECYYLDGKGWLLTNTITPDGYQVNADGAWIENGIVKTKGVGVSADSRNSFSNTNSGKKISREHFWDDYEDYSVYYAVNSFLEGNYGQMTESQIDAVKRKVAEFKKEHIKRGMSDFEKEMEIVRWIIENCEYSSAKENGDNSYDWNKGTAHSCIVNGEACCAGYADAFLYMAKACGLTARYICSDDHAWNLIKLDGDWYHVDVTWEDPDEMWGETSSFINLNDSIIRKIDHHTQWTPSTEQADGVKYGSVAVDWYLQYGNEEFPRRKDLKRLSAEQNGNVIQYRDNNQTVEEVEQYINRQIEQKKETYEYIVKTDYKYENTDSRTEIQNLDVNLKFIGVRELYGTYEDVLDQIEEQTSYKDLDQDQCYYLYKAGKITYKKEIDYTIHYMENGIEVGKKTGSRIENKYLPMECPEGYRYICDPYGNIDYTIKRGKGFCGTGGVIIYEGPVLEININVEKIKENYTYKVIYMDTDENILHISPSKTAKKDSMIYFERMEFDGYTPEKGQVFEQRLTMDDGIFYIFYEKIKEKDEQEEISEDNTVKNDNNQKDEVENQENKDKNKESENANQESEKQEERKEQEEREEQVKEETSQKEQQVKEESDQPENNIIKEKTKR